LGYCGFRKVMRNIVQYSAPLYESEQEPHLR